MAKPSWKGNLNPKYRPILERFWDKVDKSDDCWIWTGSKDYELYGNFYIESHRKVRAHRMAWELTFGAIPEGLCVCHSCDNPSCVNPSHLWLGTVTANNKDCSVKGRSRLKHGSSPGEGNYHRKLTLNQVKDIRAKYIPGRSHHAGNVLQLSKEYGVAKGTIFSIVSRQSWREWN